MNKKNILLWPVTILAILSLMISGCKKQSIYYDYENNIKEYSGNVLQYLEAQKPTFDSLLLVLDRLPDIKDSLANQQVTLFAPSNASFQEIVKELNITRKQQNRAPIYLSTCSLAALEELTCRYILRGAHLTDDYASYVDGRFYQSLLYGYSMNVQYDKINASGFEHGGPQSVVFSDPKNSNYKQNWQRASTNAVNIKAKNGVINILSSMHNYGFDEFIIRVNP